MKRMLKYEMRRISAQKKYFLIALGVILLFFVIVIIVYFSQQESVIEEADRAAAPLSYQSSIEWNKEYLSANIGMMRQEDVEFIQLKIEYYQFLLDTDTIKQDYFELSQYMGRYEGYNTFGFTFFFCEFSLYLFLIVSAFGALWAFSFEQSRGTLKNLLQSSDRKTIFRSKLLASSALVMGLPVLLFVLEFIVMACCPKKPFLIYDNGFTTLSSLNLLAQISLRNLILIAFTYAATLLCTTFFKPLVSGLAVPLSYLFIAFVAMSAASKSNFVLLNIRGFELFNVFPVVGFLNYAGGFDLAFAVPAIAHIAICALFIWFAHVRFCKKDF